MYQDIGLRNLQAVQRNGFKLVEKLKEREETRHIAYRIESALEDIDLLYKAANKIVNF